jgi:hypothetical protein
MMLPYTKKGANRMIRRLFFVFCLVSLTGISSLAQARRTITNSDLEAYRQRRVNAERELREEYTRLGFPSPEEMLRRDMDAQQQLLQLSSSLKSERLERERMELEHQRLMQAVPVFPPFGYNSSVQPGELFWPTQWGFGGRGFGRGRGFQQQGYFAGGQFWPTGPSTPPRPVIAVPPRPAPHH